MTRRSILPALLVAGSLAAAATVPAEAHGPRVGVSLNIHVPSRIPVYRVESYRPYYMGRVYFRPHRHVHAVYAFPVRGAYVPHVYCEGVLIRTGFVPGYDPRLDDWAAGYDDVVWDGALHPSHVGIDVRHRPHWAARRYVVERRYGDRDRHDHEYRHDDGHRYDHDDDHDDDDGDRRGRGAHRHDRTCNH